MNVRKLGKMTAISLVLGAAVSVTGVTPAASAVSVVTEMQVGAATPSQARQLLGWVSSGPAYFEASAQSAGVYAFEYEITGNAFFDTYVDDKTELGYVGGPTGVYRTRTLSLSAGGHLVNVVGPEGSGTASVYLVQIS